MGVSWLKNIIEEMSAALMWTPVAAAAELVERGAEEVCCGRSVSVVEVEGLDGSDEVEE